MNISSVFISFLVGYLACFLIMTYWNPKKDASEAIQLSESKITELNNKLAIEKLTYGVLAKVTDSLEDILAEKKEGITIIKYKYSEERNNIRNLDANASVLVLSKLLTTVKRNK